MQSAPKLYDWEVFETIAPYLEINELIKTSTLSKQYNYTLRNYLKKHILPKQSLQGNQSELSAAKKLLQRQIKIFNLANDEFISLTPNLILKDIQVGSVYSLLETFQGKKFIVQNSQLLSKHFEIKTFLELQKSLDSKLILLSGDYIYSAHDNKLKRISLKDDDKETFLKANDQLHFDTQIIALKMSQTHIFVVTKNTFHEYRLFGVHLKDFKSNEVLYQEANEQTKHLEIDNLSVGANAAYYISKFKVYELDVETTKEPKLMKSLKDKEIRRIINGSKHFFAVQKGSKLTSQWDTKDLIQWANKEGYEDYVKIFKSQKVAGQTLLTMDKKYMEDVLGIINVKVQQRLMVQLEQCNVQSEENSLVHGWGRNEKSQLGLNPSNPVSNPHKVTLPEGFKYLKCSNNFTLIHNKKTGQIAINSSFEGKANWKTIFKNVPNIWSINMYKDLIVLLCPVEKNHISQQFSEAPVHHKKEKLRTAKNIIDKIEWDEHIEKKDFRVGYLDKFTGILQISFDELLKSTEIKDYRIEYFKRNGEIVWSKKDRIDIL